MGKRLKTITWETNILTIKFDSQLSPLAKAITAIHEYKYNSSELGEPIEPSDILLDLIHLEWHILCLWFLNNKCELFDLDDGPIPKAIMQMFEPKACVVNAELNLWKALFNFKDMKAALNYNNALEAWTMTQIENKEEDYFNISQGLGCRAIADKLRKRKEILVKGKNPFCLDEQKTNHHFNMIAAALSITEPSYRRSTETKGMHQVRMHFRITVWHPYLYRITKLIEAFRKGVLLEDGSRQKFRRIFQRGGCLMLQDGENIKQIYPKPKEKSLTDRGKTKKTHNNPTRYGFQSSAAQTCQISPMAK